MDKMYFVKTILGDGSVFLSVNTQRQIVDFHDAADRSGLKFEVFDAAEPGDPVKLYHWFDQECPHHHIFTRGETLDVEIDGYSTIYMANPEI